MGFDPWPLEHQSHALSSELDRNLLEISEVIFIFLCLTLFTSRINRARPYRGLNDSHPQPNSDLGQLAEHETDDLEVVSSNPTRGNLFCSV